MSEPVRYIGTDDPTRGPEPGLALCLSGGGYRAMLFHVGTFWRLHETGLLGKLKRISSVSGGSIAAGMLALNWGQPLNEIVEPILQLAGRTIDVGAVFSGLALPNVTIAERVAGAYTKHLFGDATLQDLPDAPHFVINATNVQSGVLWRFTKPYMWDYRVGKVPSPEVSLATAVAASSAFSPFLSPCRLKLRSDQFEPNTGLDLQREPFTTRVLLTDGGVYDNLGLETAWKRYDTILVSDAGGKIDPEPRPRVNWLSHTRRVLEIIDNQVRSLRKRQVIDSYVDGTRKGAYWGIRTNIRDYPLDDPLDCPHERTMRLAEIPTRLKRLDPAVQQRLVNWGYAVCDAALRAHVDRSIAKPRGFPYPAVGV
jgi:NTE family protein